MLNKGHNRLKYGDIVTIEFSDDSEPIKKNKNTENNTKKQYILTADGFSFKQEGKIRVNQIDSTYQSNESAKNLFIIFSPMSDNFLTNTSILEDKIATFYTKIEQQIYFESNKFVVQS